MVTKKSPIHKRPKSTSTVRHLSDNPTAPKTISTNAAIDPLIPAKGCLLSLVIISALCVVCAFVVDLRFNPERDAMKTLNQLAKDYYIDYLYPNTLGRHLDDPASILSKFTESGLPTVRLRQLLYSSTETTDAAQFFSNAYYRCDTNQTAVRYYPVAPYGPLDYTTQFHYACESLRKIDQ